MKKCLLPFIGISATFVIAIPFLSSCSSPKSETQVMMDLYKTNKENPNSTLGEKIDYFSKGTDLTVSSKTTQGIADIRWCLEYSLFQHFMLGNGCEFTTSVHLTDDDNIYDLIPRYITPTFKTTQENIEKDGTDQLKLSYSGYLQLNVIEEFGITDGTTSESLNPGDIIQIIYAFTNIPFNNANNINDVNQGDFFTETMTPLVFGDDIIIVQVLQNGIQNEKSYVKTQNELDKNVPNYFNIRRS